MNLHPDHRLLLANDRIAERIRDAGRSRLPQRRPSSLRRSIGHSVIRIGERLAADPNLRPAQPRPG